MKVRFHFNKNVEWLNMQLAFNLNLIELKLYWINWIQVPLNFNYFQLNLDLIELNSKFVK
jgi:hypothetical protein